MLKVKFTTSILFFSIVLTNTIKANELVVEDNTDGFLREINSAFHQNRKIDWSRVKVYHAFSSSFDNFWNTEPFKAKLNKDDLRIVKQSSNRVLVRNIRITSRTSSKQRNLHLVMDSTYTLIDFYFGLPIGLDERILLEANSISYFKSAKAIVTYLEKMQTAILQEGTTLNELALSFSFNNSVFSKALSEAILLPRWDLGIDNVELFVHHIYNDVFGVRLFLNSNEYPVFENALLFLLFDLEDVEIKNVQVMSLQYLNEIKDDDDYFGMYDFDIVK